MSRGIESVNEEGSYLPLIRTPSAADKPEALRRGFDVIQQYLHESDDDADQKIKAAGMATEALIVWVHPFNDGNGRTSRFLGKFIEDGATDAERLIQETADRNERMRIYPEYLRVDDVTNLDNPDILLDDEEIEQIKKAQEELPITDGIAHSIERLLVDKSLQARVEAETERNHEARARALARNQTAA